MTVHVQIEDPEPFCPFVRRTRIGLVIVNPYQTNRDRLKSLGRVMYGDRWMSPTARAIGLHLNTLASWLGKWGWQTQTREYRYDIEDKYVNDLIKAVRQRIRELEYAIEDVRYPPWIG